MEPRPAPSPPGFDEPGSDESGSDGTAGAPTPPGGRFALASAAFFALASVAATWPLAARPGALFSSRQDAYLNLWNLDWVSRAVLGDAPLLRTDRLLHPVGLGLESQPLSLLQTVAAAPLTASAGPEVAFSVLAVLSFALAGWAACLWAARATGDGLAGLVAGAVFAFAPLHWVYLPQLNLAATGFVPLWFLAALALRRRTSPARGALAGVALALAGLSSWYYGLAVGLAAAGETVLRLARCPAPERRARLVAWTAHWVVAAALLAPLVGSLLPAFAGAPASWGTEREGLAPFVPDFRGTGVGVALPALVGWGALLLAAAGLVAPGVARATAPRGLRTGLGLVALVFGVLSFGSALELGGVRVPLPYAAVAELPVLRSARYPDRFFVVALLAVAGLAGLGAADLRRRLSGPAARIAGAALVLLPLAEAWPGMVRLEPSAPDLPFPAGAAAGAVLHVPTTLRNLDGEAMLYQTRHGRPIAGGYRTRGRDALEDERRADAAVGPAFLRRPPELGADWVAALRASGFAWVALQRRAWIEGAPGAPSAPSVVGPFALDGGRELLRRRLWPHYPLHDRLPESEAAWRPALEELLGPPRGSSDTYLLFEVPAR